MKKVYLLLLLALGGIQQVAAQEPDPELFRTWYLTNVTIDNTSTAAEYPYLSVSIYNETEGYYIWIPFLGGTNGYRMFDLQENPFSFSIPEEFDIGLPKENCVGSPFGIACVEIHTLHAKIYDNRPASFLYVIASNDDGSFSLDVTNENGDVAHYSSVLLSTETFTKQDVSIFPNPTSNILTISSETLELKAISVFNVSGQLVLEQKNNGTSIDVSMLERGIYFLEAQTENGKAVRRFVKD